MKYLRLFDTHAEYEDFLPTEEFIRPNVSYCKLEEEVHYNPFIFIDYSQEYLTFVAKADGTFKFSGSTTANTLSYSLDNGNTWIALTNNTDSPTVTSGNKILWKGTCTPQSNKGIGRFYSTSQFDIEGNAMSLLYGDDFKGQTSLEGKVSVLSGLFSGNTNVVSAENLSLPATTVAQTCYQNMFYGCKNLTKAPSVLPATTLAQTCYQNMFRDCTNLATAPELPATTLVYSCYSNMFQGCTSLNSVTCLATDISATSCTDSWLNSVASSGTFTKASSMSDWTTGTNGIPTNWTVENAS